MSKMSKALNLKNHFLLVDMPRTLRGRRDNARKYCWHQPSAKQSELTMAWEKNSKKSFPPYRLLAFLWDSVMTAMILAGKIIRMQNLWSCGYTFVFSVILCAISKINNSIISRWFFIENKHLLERENVPRCNSQFGGSIWTEEAVLIRASTEYH